LTTARLVGFWEGADPVIGVIMASSATRLSRLAQVSAALLDAVDALTEEFPEVPVSIVYEKVGEARGVAAAICRTPSGIASPSRKKLGGGYASPATTRSHRTATARALGEQPRRSVMNKRGGDRVPTMVGQPAPDLLEVNVLLIVALVLLVLFAGFGFVAHVLWWGLILALIIGVAHLLTGRRA